MHWVESTQNNREKAHPACEEGGDLKMAKRRKLSWREATQRQVIRFMGKNNLLVGRKLLKDRFIVNVSEEHLLS